METATSIPMWGDILTNKILATASVILFLLYLGDLFKLMPPMIYSMGRPRGISTFEHNVSIARIRNRIAIICILPFCLIADRFSLYEPTFFRSIPPQWSAVATTGALIAYLSLRQILNLAISPRLLGRDNAIAAKRSLYSFFILLCFVMILTTGAVIFFKADGSVSRIVFYSEIALFFLCSTVKTTQFLRNVCSKLHTFLYLCTLEIVPAAVLVLSTLV